MLKAEERAAWIAMVDALRAAQGSQHTEHGVLVKVNEALYRASVARPDMA